MEPARLQIDIFEHHDVASENRQASIVESRIVSKGGGQFMDKTTRTWQALTLRPTAVIDAAPNLKMRPRFPYPSSASRFPVTSMRDSFLYSYASAQRVLKDGALFLFLCSCRTVLWRPHNLRARCCDNVHTLLSRRKYRNLKSFATLYKWAAERPTEKRSVTDRRTAEEPVGPPSMDYAGATEARARARIIRIGYVLYPFRCVKASPPCRALYT